ncbi:hypothetical protein G7054_g67 [Neopestalotiopsis clavispora]|nr:hypothetical protein G7054_g67 [Neopestalotiopsis clavispora]
MPSLQIDKSSIRTTEPPNRPLDDWHHPRSRSVLISLKAYPKIALYSFLLSLSALLVGYDVVILGSVVALPIFQRDFGEHYGNISIIPSMWLALWNASTFIGQMFGAILGGWVQDKKGRRTSLVAGSLVSAAAVAICYTAYLPEDVDARRGMFLGGKVVMGVALGMLMTTTQTVISEIAPPDLRGSALALLPTNILLGQFLGSAAVFALSNDDTRRSYLAALATQWLFFLVVFIVAMAAPESPSYLVAGGQYSRALRSLARLHTSRVDLPAMLDQVRHFVLHEEQFFRDKKYLDSLGRRHRRQTGIVLFAGIIPQLFGLGFLSQSGYFMQTIGMQATLSLAVLALGVILGLVANVIGLWTVSKVGRRKLILISLVVSAFLWFGMGVAGFWSGTVTMWYSAGTFMAIVIVNGLGSWPASYAVAGEASSLLLRGKTQGLNWFTNSFFSGIVSVALPFLYNPDAGALGARTGFVFFGLCVVGVFVSWLIIPEMKGRDHAEIERMFELRIPTRAFRKWSEAEDTQELRQI